MKHALHSSAVRSASYSAQGCDYGLYVAQLHPFTTNIDIDCNALQLREYHSLAWALPRELFHDIRQLDDQWWYWYVSATPASMPFVSRRLTAFAASVWINNHFISTASPGTSSDRINTLFTFPAGSVKAGQDNVITIIQDHMGNDEHAGGRASAFFHLLSATDIGVTQRSLHGASRASHLREATSLSGKCKESSAGTPGTFSLSGLVYVCVTEGLNIVNVVDSLTELGAF